MSRRMEALKRMIESGASEPFTRYALALEYKSAGMLENALEEFQTLRQQAPDYVPMYLMAGQMLVDQGEHESAIEWLKRGCVEAERKGDLHARDEMQLVLDQVQGF